MKHNWPEIIDCWGMLIEKDDILLSSDGQKFIVADLENLEEFSDGKKYQYAGSLREGESPRDGVERAKQEYENIKKRMWDSLGSVD